MSVGFLDGLKQDYNEFKKNCSEYFHEDYAKKFPTNVPSKAAQSFVMNASIVKICGGTYKAAFLSGALSAMTSLLEAITRPFVRSLLPDNPGIAKWVQILAPHRTVSRMLLGSVVDLTPISTFVVGLLKVNPLNPTGLEATSLGNLFAGLKLTQFFALNRGFYEKDEGYIAIAH
jgi:hypothetical protein